MNSHKNIRTYLFRIITSLMLSWLLGTASICLAQADTWTAKSPLPTARSLLSASTVDGKIYAIGGRQYSSSSASSAVEQYDPATDTWTTKAPMPTARQWLSTSAVNGKIYAFGGTPITYQPALSTVEEYDPATDTWTEKAPMPTARFVFSTSVVDGKIYAIGGVLRATAGGAEPRTSVVEAYDPATDTWTTKTPMPTTRAFLATSVVNGKIYAIGGALSGGSSILSTVEEYNPATDTWTTKAPMPTARTTVLATSAVNGIIYVIGGVRYGTVISTVEAYDPATDTWTTKTPMPRARGFLATSALNEKIYAIGGSLGSPWSGISTVEEYDATPPLVVDFNGDGIVDSADMSIMVDHWHTDYPLCDIAPAPFGDGIVDVQDLILLSEHLFEEIFPVELMEYWKLDEEEGDIAYNSISDNYGIISGDPTWQPDNGQVTGALEFDGINDYVETDFVLNPADGAFSVFAWIQGGAPGQVIISQANGIGTGETWLGMDTLGGNLMTGLRPPGTRSPTPPMVSDFVITDGQWHHVGIVVTPYGVRNLYADGMRVAFDTQGVNLPSSNGGLYFGTSKTLEAGTFFSGLIDDVRIYDVVLSAEEIAALAQ